MNSELLLGCDLKGTKSSRKFPLLLAGFEAVFSGPSFLSMGRRERQTERENFASFQQGRIDRGSQNQNGTQILGSASLGARAGPALWREVFPPGILETREKLAAFSMHFTPATPVLASRGCGTQTPGPWTRGLRICSGVLKRPCWKGPQEPELGPLPEFTAGETEA